MWGQGPALYKHNYFIHVIRGSRPALHFRPPLTLPEDYSQFLAASAESVSIVAEFGQQL